MNSSNTLCQGYAKLHGSCQVWSIHTYNIYTSFYETSYPKSIRDTSHLLYKHVSDLAANKNLSIQTSHPPKTHLEHVRFGVALVLDDHRVVARQCVRYGVLVRVQNGFGGGWRLDHVIL